MKKAAGKQSEMTTNADSYKKSLNQRVRGMFKLSLVILFAVAMFSPIAAHATTRNSNCISPDPVVFSTAASAPVITVNDSDQSGSTCDDNDQGLHAPDVTVNSTTETVTATGNSGTKYTFTFAGYADAADGQRTEYTVRIVSLVGSGSDFVTLGIDPSEGGAATTPIDVQITLPGGSRPTVTAISPSSGTAAGGTTVTLTGTGFTGATGVTIGGTVATNVTVVNSTTITAVTPAGSAGTASVLVTTPGGTNVANTLYTYVAAPTVSGISPSSGTAAGGNTSTITGTNFTSATGVRFGATNATGLTVVSSTQITATVPSGTGTVDVTVTTTSGGTSATNAADHYTYVAGPTATQAIPSVALTKNHATGSFTPVTGSGTATPLSYSVSPSLPAGLSMSPTTGAITGTPTGTSSATTYTVTVTDANSATATATFSLTVNSAVTATQAVASISLTANHAATSLTPVTGSGGTSPLSYSVSPTLPTGLSMSASTGAISGTPTVASSTTPYTVTVTDANNATATASFVLTVADVVVATQVDASTSLTQNHTATSFIPVNGSGGTSPLSYSVSPTLPTGLSISASTGVISGTPTATASATNYTVTVTDANSATATATFSLTVTDVVVATQAIASTSLTQNHTTTSFTPVTGSGGTSPLSYSVSPTLPTGLSISAGTGAITGTPTVTSSATTYTVTVTDRNSATATSTFSLTVTDVVVATQATASTSLTQNQTTTSFTPVTGSGGTSPLSYSVSPALPTGLSMSASTGAITGTPTVTASATTYTVTVTDANSATATATFSLTVNLPLTAGAKSVTAAYNSNGTTSTAIDLTSSITGGTATSVTVSAGPFHGSTTSSGLVVTYTPTTDFYGSDSFTYTATGTGGPSSPATVTISVSLPTITVSPTSLADGVVNTMYSQSLTASGGGAPYIFSTNVASGALPAGLHLSSAGAITGTPTAACTCNFTVSGTDSSTGSGPASFTSPTISLTILAAPPTVTTITPALGLGSGGTDVTITGTFFTPSSTVKFGATSATSVTYISPTSLTAVAPTGTGVVDVTVTSAGGTSTTSGADQFTYLSQVQALTNPLGVAVDGSGNIYIADSGLSDIVKVPVGCAALSCETSVGGSLANLTGVAVDGNGNIYALSGGGSGTVTRLPWNAVTGNYGAQTTLATGLSLPTTSPTGIAVDGLGNLYFTDTANKRVVELPWIANAGAYGAQILLFTGSGSSAPGGIAVDGIGNIFVTDAGTQTLTQIKPGGTQATLATGINAQSVAVDGSGNIYYSDSVANTVTKLPWDGSTFGPQVIVATALSVPYGVAVDDSGNLFIANNTPKTVTKATVTVPPSMSFASTKVNATSTDSPQSATLANIGNAPLSFPPVSGINPAISTGFTLANSATCPQVFANSASQSLAQGASCKYAVNFSPTSTNVGQNNGTLVATDTSLNAAVATQTIALSGTGIAEDVSRVTLTLNPVSPVVFGKAVAITAMVEDTVNTGTTPTGNVDFTATNSASVVTTINPAVALSGGSAIVSSFTPSTVGTYTITGNYTGIAGNIAPSSGTASLTVTKFTPVLAYPPTIAAQTYSSAITAAALNATAVDANGVSIPGIFVYTTTVNSGITTLVAGTTVLPASSYIITATFTPTDTTDYVSGGTITASYVVTKTIATVTLGSLSQTYTATAHAATAVTAPAGLNVSYTYNGSSVAPVAAGSYTVIATANDVNYTGTATGTLIITKASPAIVLLSSSINPVQIQNTVLLTATVSSPLSAPTGSVIFLDGSTVLGTGSIADGVATLSTTALAGGSHSITATYQGDTNFLPLSSSALSQMVLDFTLNISTGGGQATVAPGGTATYQFTVSPSGAAAFPAAVTLTVSGLPVGATYTIAPSTINAGSGATNAILTIIAPQGVAHLERNGPRFGLRVAPIGLALLLLPFFGRIRRARKDIGRLMAVFFLLMAGLGATSILGCGTGNGFLGQQQKSYTVTVTATSGALTHSTTVELTVE